MDFRPYGFDGERLKKREELLELGASPYPYSFAESSKVAGIQEEVRRCEEEGRTLPAGVVIAGRVWSRRNMGKSVFWDIKDETGKIQAYLTRDGFSEDIWKQMQLLDPGDIVGLRGDMFRTRAGELTVKVTDFTLLCKGVVPIPMGKETADQVYYRLADTETKYRERYMQWLLDPEDHRRMYLRSKIISAIRRWMEGEGFLEVSTPSIEFVYGGAEARPFKTSIWALGNREAYLRISPELYLKRYIVGGFEKVFTICQNFRNEGIDHSHNPEFTMMEWYEAYTDYEFQMKRFETLVSAVAKEICGSTTVSYQGTEVNLDLPWRRISMLDALKEFAGIDAGQMSTGQLEAEFRSRSIEPPQPLTWGLAVAELFAATCEKQLVQPTFIIDHPMEISPLTKVKRGDPRLVERFEPYICGMEIGNAYSELTDPVDQVERFVSQRENRSGDEYENHPVDADFVRAIGCGMPPTGGVGIGIDRLIMLLTDAPSIRDIIPFPMFKPRT